MSNIVLEEYELMKDSKYRAYMSSVDKALRSFEYTSEWADLISALGKLNKVLLANTKFPVIPRRIKISKRLAQCMHPVLPSGVHLKALETYDIIFKCMGTSRLSYELFIYSSGLFPLLGHAAMIVRPSLLTVYETHFVPLGERLTPALSGFLSGVLPGLEEGSDHFDRTNSLLEKVCDGVGKATFYGCLWECLASNASIRLPGINFALSHFNKKLSMEDQLHVMGTSVDTMVVALCAAVQDTSVLVQRSTLDLLLAGLPMHNSQLVRPDMLQLVTAALTTILRRDMSLNRRLFAWLLGTEVGSGTSELRRTLSSEGHNYFDLYSRDLLVQAVKKILSQGQTQPKTPDLRPYKLLVSLLDKPDIGPVILDDILHEVFRTLYLSCEGTAKDGNRKNLSQSMYRGSQELLKTANLLFSALEPSYVWQFAGTLFENACKGAAEENEMVESGCEQDGPVKPVDSGSPNIVEVCSLTQFLLDMVSLDTYADTPTEHLPGLFLRVLVALTKHCSYLSATELASSLQLCRRVLVRVQPGSWGGPAPHTEEDDRGSHVSLGSEVRESDDATHPEPIPQANAITNEVTESSLTSSITENLQNSLVSTESLKNKVTLTEDATAAPPVYLDSEGTLDLTDPVSIDSDSSSASLLMDSSHTPVEATLQDSKSTKADTSLPEDWTQKASELQSLVDCTVPTGSLEASTCDTTSIISESTTLPFYDTSQTSMELSTQETKDWATLITEKAESIPIHSPVTPQIKINDENPSLKFVAKEISENDSVGDKSSRQHSVMSESLAQFQELFVRLVTKRILSAETDLATALHHLLSIPPKDSTEHRTRELENKLKECLGKLDTDKQANKGIPALQQGALAMPGPEWPELQECLNQACRLLVELSTFPTLCTPGRTPTTDREPLTFGEVPRRFPAWLQTLLVLCAGLNTSSSAGASSLQLLAAATFLDLLALLRAVPTSQQESLQQSRGVVTVLIIPLLTPAQVAFIEGYTAVFQTMARLLWDHLGAPCPSNHLQCAQLLLRLHNALPGSDVVEDVIGGSLNPDPQIERYQAGNQEDSQRVAEAFERFTTLWHLSREPGDLQVSQCRALDKSLFKMLDNLKRPPGPLQLQTQGWLLQALLRGDTARILEPLLLILLAPGTARVSVLHCTVSHASTVLAKHSTPSEQGSEMGSSAARIFALSTQDGHVVYHVSEASCVPGRAGAQTCTPGVQARRIHAVTRLASGAAKQPAPHCITESAFLRAAAELEENHKMSLIVNPMTDMEAESDSGQSFEEPSSHSSSSEWSKDATEPKVTEQRVVEGVLQEILDAVVQRDSTLEASSTSTAVHALHSHMLLYAQVYDAQRTLYALGAVRSLLLTSPRLFLCSTASTGLAHGSSRGAALVTLLARHAQAAQGGRSFEGELGAEWTAAARSSMLLEALVSSLLWFTRSYYPNLGQARLTTAELAANRQVQLASAELLTLLLAELALLARDGGRGLAQYLADLLQRSRLPRLTLGLLLASVHAARGLPRPSANSAQCFTEEILQFNHETETKRPASCPHRLPAHVEASQVQLLRLVLALVMLEEQASRQTRDAPESAATSGGGSSTPTSPVTPSGQQLRYLPGCPVPQQPIFLAAVMSALKLEHMSHLHQSWTVMLASALPFMGSALPHVVLKVATQLCNNLERLAKLYCLGTQGLSTQCCLPAQYAATQLEALATLLHYCLLDSAQQLIGQPLASTVSTIQASFPDAQPGQIFSNLMNFFVPAQQQGPNNPRQDLQDKSLPQLTAQFDDEPIEHDEASGMREKPGVNGGESLQEARRLVLSSLPRIMACATSLWQAVSQAEEGEGSVLGSPRAVRHQLVQFLSPIALHHGTHFLAAIAVVAASDSNPNKSPLESTEQQKVLVSLISSIRVLPFDTLVQTVQTVVRQPPSLVGAQQNLEVSLLEVLSSYLQTAVSAPQLAESWSALLALLRECVALPPPTPFLALALLSSLVHRATPPAPAEKRDARSVHDVTTKLVETCSQLAGACLEQTTWLRRNLAVREDASPEPQPTTPSPTSSMTRVDTAIGANYRYSLQAQNVLAELLAPLLDVAFGSQDKERVVALLAGVLANITPYLRNHSVRNSVSFRACSQLLASVSGYQYTRRAWKKEALELLLDPAFFQMEPQCLPSWKAIVDNLMAHDATTFRDLLAKVSMPQSGSLSLFSSKEQELEQRAQLLKRLAFVLFCGEIDQYQKHMHEIQERLADCLRLPQAVPSLQAQVFLCFRVLLMRMSSHHVTSLWPIVISELVQAMLHMEHQLTSGSSEHLRAHLRLLSGLDAAWALDNSNGLNSTGHPAWLALQLAACKLLDLMLALPASRLPQFTMYRWAFVGDFDNTAQNGDLVREEREEREVSNSMRCPDFIPHVKRLSKLLDAQVPAGASLPVMLAAPGQPLLHATSIQSLQQLQGFFSSLAGGTRPSINAASSDWEQAVEQVLDNDFLEPLPSK